MISLGNIQWKFKKTGEISDLTNLKNKVLNALGTNDPITGNLIAGHGLDNIPLERARILTGNFDLTEIQKGGALFDLLEDDESFSLIFEVIN